MTEPALMPAPMGVHIRTSESHPYDTSINWLDASHHGLAGRLGMSAVPGRQGYGRYQVRLPINTLPVANAMTCPNVCSGQPSHCWCKQP